MRFDVAIIGDLRLKGGATLSIAYEVQTLAQAGYSVAVCHVSSRDHGPSPALHCDIAHLIDEGVVHHLSADERVEAGLLALQLPGFGATGAPALPHVDAGTKIIVARQTPIDGCGHANYDPAQVHAMAEAAFGDGFAWAPIGPLSRANMEQAAITAPLLEEDWTPIIVAEYPTPRRDKPLKDIPVMGRHSRPHAVKWPATREEILRIYPDDPTVEVRVLGIGDDLKKIVGEYPRNWVTYFFNDIAPTEFLRTIDFFVYYHHPSWVEAFGRSIGEAIASGCVAVLPHHFKEVYGEAALYRDPADVVQTVRDLHLNWERYLRQSRLGQSISTKKFGPSAYLDRIDRLLPKSGRGRSRAGSLHRFAGVLDRPDKPRNKPTPPPVAATPGSREAIHETDVVVIGDLRTVGESAWRIANEVRIQADAGYSTALMHLNTADPELPGVNPMIDACVREGLAVPVNPETDVVRAKIAVLHRPEALFPRPPERLPRLDAKCGVVVAGANCIGPDTPHEFTKWRQVIGDLLGERVLWAPISSTSRGMLSAVSDTTLLHLDWTPSVHASTQPPKRPPMREAPVVGCVCLADQARWPIKPSGEAASPPNDGAMTVRILCAPRPIALPADPAPTWELLRAEEIDPLNFLRNLDFLVYYPEGKVSETPVHAIAWAMANGIVAILPRKLKKVFGTGPLYREPGEVSATIQRYSEDRPTYDNASWNARHEARHRFGSHVHRERLAALVGPRQPIARSPRSSPARKRVLFLSPNGTGLGHMTRQIAVARRCPRKIEPIFATMSQATKVVEQAGYPVEYIPSSVYLTCGIDEWNPWYDKRLNQILDYYGAEAVVYDGSYIHDGLVKAVPRRRGCRLVWIRRGMWKRALKTHPTFSKQKFVDLVIEPTDIAESRDEGATVPHRQIAVRVPPIRLLDPEELLGRREAAATLHLDPDRPAVLIQLGSGTNRDIVSLVDRILDALRRRPEVQPVIAEWLISPASLDLWPGIKRLRGFPFSRYFNAFDFTISAAGYNSFTEILSFGLPAIFIPNDNMIMDDQCVRADFAMDEGAAFHVPEAENHRIDHYIDLLLDASVRERLRTNALRLRQPNGAEAAAEIIAALVE